MATILGRDAERKSSPPPRVPTAASRLSSLLLAVGLALSAIGVIDLGLAWFPLRFGNAEWEFGTISRTFDGLALGTLGFSLVTGAAAFRGSRLFLRTMAILSAGLLLALLGAAVVYGLSAVVALSAVPAEAAPLLERAIARTGAFAAVYVVLYGWLVWFNWRQAGVAERSGE